MQVNENTDNMKPDPDAQAACNEFYSSLNLDSIPPNHNLQGASLMKNIPSGPEAARTETQLKAPKKRKRVVISCTECHRRKQKVILPSYHPLGLEV